jgi:hypothetical protein
MGRLVGWLVGWLVAFIHVVGVCECETSFEINKL